VALLFGRERWGLNNDEISLADVIVTAPVNPAFASINIAQAVLLMGYEWFRIGAPSLGQQTPELPALDGPGLMTPDTRPATKEELYGFFDHLKMNLTLRGSSRRRTRSGMLRNIQPVFAGGADGTGGQEPARHVGIAEPGARRRQERNGIHGPRNLIPPPSAGGWRQRQGELSANFPTRLAPRHPPRTQAEGNLILSL
jgi:tRNA/rRNA methyltransferase